MLTGMIDDTSLRRNHELEEQCREGGTGSTIVQACYILNESTMQGVGPIGDDDEGTMTNEVRAFAVFCVLCRPLLPTSIA